MTMLDNHMYCTVINTHPGVETAGLVWMGGDNTVRYCVVNMTVGRRHPPPPHAHWEETRDETHRYRR